MLSPRECVEGSDTSYFNMREKSDMHSSPSYDRSYGRLSETLVQIVEQRSQEEDFHPRKEQNQSSRDHFSTRQSSTVTEADEPQSRSRSDTPRGTERNGIPPVIMLRSTIETEHQDSALRATPAKEAHIYGKILAPW